MNNPASQRFQMSGISKSFGTAKVLDDVSFDAHAGEIVALLGSNGAGKSTLMKILTGVYTRDTGDILVNGTLAEISSPRDAANVGITFLPQEISVFPDMSVAENIAIAELKVGLTDWVAMRKRAAVVLDELGFGHINPMARVGDLSVAEQRIVEIARAFGGDAEILVMDEPTASLSETESAQIFKILKRLKERNTTVVYISHYLKEVFEIADRIVVLRDGQNAGDFYPDKVDIPTVVDAMLGQAAGALFEDRAPLDVAAPIVFSARNLMLPGRIDDVSLDVRKGEILGVFGLIGSGVETLGRLMFGAEGRGYGGQMTLDGVSYAPKSPRHAKTFGMGFVTAERKTDGLLADLSVSDNLVSAFQTDFGSNVLTSRTQERTYTTGWIDKLGIKTSGPDQEIRLLSGGNQQKVCVARWLNPKVKMLILEEPTRGVDIGARRELYSHLVAFAANGLSILVLSSDVEEVAGLSDRALVIDRGRIVAGFDHNVEASDLMAATARSAADADHTAGVFV